MNRYNRGPTIGGPSRATASTTCQKCLKKDMSLSFHAGKRLTRARHYSYECKAVIQERPYVPRPSRTQQLLNPKLVPKLTNDAPQDLLRKKGVADEQLARLEEERGRKHDRDHEDHELAGASKRRRSASSASSTSVSTISTNMSRSRSPPPAVRDSTNFPVKSEHSPPIHDRGKPMRVRTPRSPEPRQPLTDSERKRRRGSVSSSESYASGGRSRSRERADSRSTRRRFKERSPEARGRRTESRSPHRDRGRGFSNDRRRMHDREKPGPGYGAPPGNDTRRNRSPPRQRSLSPFSKRLALTQAMNR